MYKSKMYIVVFFMIFFFCKKASLVFIDKHCLSGLWKLRFTNDKKLNDYVFLQLNNDDSFVLRSVKSDGILATKTSKYGKINFDNNHNLIRFNNFRKRSRMSIQIKSINKFSYSLFGVEIPEIKYDSDDSYNIEHIIDVKNYDKTLFIRDIDTNKYYIFDITNGIEKKPFVEMSFNTLLFSQFFGFLVNYILVKMIN